jgi:16S rRNA (cytosine1402-N4)-methyltransferase
MSGIPPEVPPSAPRPVHVPVLLRETLAAIDLRPGLVVVDGTVGAAGHSRAILPKILPNGRLIGLDRDPMMLAHAAAALGESENVILKHASYAELGAILDDLATPHVDRMLLDLGLSSDQLADRHRGFGFKAGGPLDLRFNATQGRPASELLQTLEAEELTRIFRDYGEERHAAAIARAIMAQRTGQPVTTAERLAEVVAAAAGPARGRDATHPATRVFQALRIAVNDELGHLERFLREVAPARIAPGGTLAVISFHSLEDRIVKDAFRETEQWTMLTKKPVTASPVELRLNPRSRSAKLRAAVRK